jgi:dTDP-4-amino-4,6-dideoxygalactose transaminase
MLKAETVPVKKGPSHTRVQVPFIDLHSQFNQLRDEVLRAMEEVAASTTYILGPRVAEFEKAFAAQLGARHCIGVNSGTSALHLALLAAGVGRGDEVITVPMTFVATTWAISYVGAIPVFVDADPATYTLDVSQVKKKITRRTRAFLPVHLYGQPADLEPVLDLGKQYGIPVVEDAAQAHGARYRGKPAGSFGLCGCFSFYPGKNLGAYGEGGALVTNDDAVARRVRSLRDHAQSERYHHDEIGFNYRMDALQGAVLSIKLKHLDQWTAARRRLATRYQDLLAELPLQLPVEAAGREHVWHLFVVLHPDRDRLRQALDGRGIVTGLHYPVPVHLQKAYRHLGHSPGDFPVAERVGRECLSLPLFPEMTVAQQDAVARALAETVQEANWR